MRGTISIDTGNMYPSSQCLLRMKEAVQFDVDTNFGVKGYIHVL